MFTKTFDNLIFRILYLFFLNRLVDNLFTSKSDWCFKKECYNSPKKYVTRFFFILIKNTLCTLYGTHPSCHQYHYHQSINQSILSTRTIKASSNTVMRRSFQLLATFAHIRNVLAVQRRHHHMSLMTSAAGHRFPL